MAGHSIGGELIGDEHDDSWGHVQEFAGLFAGYDYSTPEEDQYLWDVQLLGCTPAGSLLAALDRIGTRRAALEGWADLYLHDAKDRRMGRLSVYGVTVLAAQPSERGAGLWDITVELCGDSLSPACELPWRLRRSGTLDRPGLWHGLDRAGRMAWAGAALFSHRPPAPEKQWPPHGHYRLDGRHIVDEYAFYCALGEAVNGPGGYFGWNLDALNDCLCLPSWGGAASVTLEWEHSGPSRTALDAELLDPAEPGRGSVLRIIDEIFERNGVAVLLR
ncbi:barstar family protein [Kitasatospora sp. NPDC004614]|uniref:barstar family protein n=1 Tax=unclassified Kitasatospora TaxID=2633591 RepID=UPI0036CFE277